MKEKKSGLFDVWNITGEGKIKTRILRYLPNNKIRLEILGSRGACHGTVALTKKQLKELIDDLLEAGGPWDET